MAAPDCVGLHSRGTDMIVTATIVALLAAWLLLSVLTIARAPWLSGRRRWDVFQLLSTWRLFVASDGTRPAALVLLVRDRDRDGRIGAPVRFSTGALAWSVSMIFWRRDWDRELLMRRLCKEVRKHRTGPLPRAYWHLVHAVRSADGSETVEARQFIILETRGAQGDVPRQVFASQFHRL